MNFSPLDIVVLFILIFVETWFLWSWWKAFGWRFFVALGVIWVFILSLVFLGDMPKGDLFFDFVLMHVVFIGWYVVFRRLNRWTF